MITKDPTPTRMKKIQVSGTGLKARIDYLEREVKEYKVERTSLIQQLQEVKKGLGKTRSK